MVKQNHLKRDFWIIVGSVVLAIILVKTGVLADFLIKSQEAKFIGSIIAGFFFTSAFTIAPATIALAAISQTASPVLVAFWAAFGAVLGDLVLFIFIRESLSDDLLYLLKKNKSYRKIFHFFRLHRLRWLAPILGGLIIASPLPDELGLAVMGLSRLRTIALVPISFAMNYLGVLLVAFVARTI